MPDILESRVNANILITFLLWSFNFDHYTVSLLIKEIFQILPPKQQFTNTSSSTLYAGLPFHTITASLIDSEE